eukprot:g8703.t1
MIQRLLTASKQRKNDAKFTVCVKLLNAANLHLQNNASNVFSRVTCSLYPGCTCTEIVNPTHNSRHPNFGQQLNFEFSKEDLLERREMMSSPDVGEWLPSFVRVELIAQNENVIGQVADIPIFFGGAMIVNQHAERAAFDEEAIDWMGGDNAIFRSIVMNSYSDKPRLLMNKKGNLRFQVWVENGEMWSHDSIRNFAKEKLANAFDKDTTHVAKLRNRIQEATQKIRRAHGINPNQHLQPEHYHYLAQIFTGYRGSGFTLCVQIEGDSHDDDEHIVVKSQLWDKDETAAKIIGMDNEPVLVKFHYSANDLNSRINDIEVFGQGNRSYINVALVKNDGFQLCSFNICPILQHLPLNKFEICAISIDEQDAIENSVMRSLGNRKVQCAVWLEIDGRWEEAVARQLGNERLRNEGKEMEQWRIENFDYAFERKALQKQKAVEMELNIKESESITAAAAALVEAEAKRRRFNLRKAQKKRVKSELEVLENWKEKFETQTNIPLNAETIQSLSTMTEDHLEIALDMKYGREQQLEKLENDMPEITNTTSIRGSPSFQNTRSCAEELDEAEYHWQRQDLIRRLKSAEDLSFIQKLEARDLGINLSLDREEKASIAFCDVVESRIRDSFIQSKGAKILAQVAILEEYERLEELREIKRRSKVVATSKLSVSPTQRRLNKLFHHQERMKSSSRREVFVNEEEPLSVKLRKAAQVSVITDEEAIHHSPILRALSGHLMYDDVQGAQESINLSKKELREKCKVIFRR